MNYDILVVGGGIGGMESALKLGDMGYKVLLVEKEASVGGKMILLSKVFPTLDCSSCISTPKMAATSHHPNVNLMVYSEVDQIKKNSDGTFSATVRQKPTFVDPNLCTGCRQCETGCNVAVPDQFNSDMVSRRAAYIAFPQAVPKKAVIERQGTSPCSYTCPTGIKAHGYVALARTGKYDEAFDLILESTPLVGSLGRACYAPCQDQCTRKDIDGAVSIRRIKRFVADRYYSSHPETVYKLGHKDHKDHNASFKACPSIPMPAALEVAATKDIPSDSGVLQLAGNPGAPQGLDPSGPSAANYQQYLTSGYETGAYKKVAVVGSGPAGLTCAMHLARQGYQVKIFEAQAQPGGMLTLAIPDFRLPRAVVERDIKNVTGLGVIIQTGIKIQNPLELKEQGFDAVFLATGTHGTGKMGIEGENLEGVVTSLDFLRQANLGLAREGSTKESSLEANTSGGSSSFENSSKNSSIKESNSFTDKPLQKSSPLNLTLIKDKTVLVVGGGNVAIDSARVAVRLGAGRVIVQYRRGRQEMPAHDWEIEAAEKEGIEFQYLCAPVKFKGRGGRLATVESLRMELGEADHKGRRSPVPVKGSEFETAADLVITAVGLVPDTGDFAGALKLNGNRTISVDQDTLQTGTPYIFAGGDAVSGPSMIVSAAGQGRRAAFYIDRYLRGEDLKAGEFDYKLPMMDREQVLKRQQSYKILPPVESTEKVHAGVRDFAETEGPFDPEEALYSAGRCLDCGVCSQCQQCVDICPADAINMSMKEEVTQIKAGAVIVSTGFKLFPADAKPQYGYGRYKNVITGMQMDRLLAPTRPYNSVLRPGDGKVPDSIAYILCTGSRDQTVGNPLCSRVCCMYSIKQNQLIMGALPLADVTVYYIDIRAFSKGYEEFYQQARGMGANFVKGKVAKIEETENGNLTLLYEDIENGGEVKTAEHDMVVLSVGILPNTEVFSLFSGVELAQDEYFYVQEVDEDINPGKTSIEGVFVAGTASGARDIPDVILHAGACAAQAAAYVERTRVMS